MDEQAIRAYYAKALERAATLGVKSIVFGSAGAKRVPEGFDMDRAYQQVVQVTCETGEAAAKYGITIVIEPVRMPDCNIINTFAEGVQLAKTVGLDNVKVLIDFYHMVCEKETPKYCGNTAKSICAMCISPIPAFPRSTVYVTRTTSAPSLRANCTAGAGGAPSPPAAKSGTTPTSSRR